MQRVDESKATAGDEARLEVDCSGGHLCVEDYYSSSYLFSGKRKGGDAELDIDVDSWTMHHDVRGPKKDQTIETVFKKATEL